MRAAAHQLIAGAGTFTVVAVAKARNPSVRLPDPVFAGVVAALASGLPDVLEPATSPRHRQFFHSFAFASLVALSWNEVYEWQPETSFGQLVRDVLLSVGLGYIAHLGADATTADGLPLLGNLMKGMQC